MEKKKGKTLKNIIERKEAVKKYLKGEISKKELYARGVRPATPPRSISAR
ncbi:hypothetical protein BPO_0033 [Bergeyella porcorum]|uniref:Uncharacterized protein n=1 Tax=Bergeyella porcorum TaxID=1735111 RepID=A0AAU0F3Y7_9FLAO